MSCDTMGRTSTLTLPNLVAKDWAQLERAIEDELEEGVARAFVRVPTTRWSTDAGRVETFVHELSERGIDVDVVRMPEPFAGVYLG